MLVNHLMSSMKARDLKAIDTPIPSTDTHHINPFINSHPSTHAKDQLY